MEHHKTCAFVFQTKPHRDFDKRVIFLTQDFGKMTAIASHAQKSRRRFGGALEPLTRLSITYSMKHASSLANLQEVSIENSFSKLKQNIYKFAYASYFSELISEVMREDENSSTLFEYLNSYLNALEKSQNEELLCRLFEARLLTKIGYRPQLKQCLQCGETLHNLKSPILFSETMGGILCQSCLSDRHPEHGEGSRRSADIKEVPKEAIEYLEEMILEKRGLKTDVKLGHALKTFLPSFLFYHLGKEPKSYGFLNMV